MNVRPIDPQAVVEAVEAYYYLIPGSLVDKDATATTREARSAAVYLLRTVAGQSIDEISDMLHRDKATIYFSLNSTLEKFKHGNFADRVSEIKDQLVPQDFIFQGI